MLEEGYVVSVIDNSSTSTGDSLDRVKDIVGEERAQNLNVYPCDITDKDDLSTTMVSINAAMRPTGGDGSRIHMQIALRIALQQVVPSL